jgi:hypothetical protein
MELWMTQLYEDGRKVAVSCVVDDELQEKIEAIRAAGYKFYVTLNADNTVQFSIDSYAKQIEQVTIKNSADNILMLEKMIRTVKVGPT